MILTRLDADANVVIPAEMLERLGVKPGDQIAFEIIDGELSVFRYPTDDEIDEDTELSYGELRALIKEADDDPRPSVPIDEAFANVRRRLEKRWAADDA